MQSGQYQHKKHMDDAGANLQTERFADLATDSSDHEQAACTSQESKLVKDDKPDDASTSAPLPARIADFRDVTQDSTMRSKDQQTTARKRR